MSARRFILPMALGLLAGIIISGAVVAIVVARMQVNPPVQAANLEVADASGLPVLWNAPAFSYIDQDGNRVTNRDLLGCPWIADFFFTRCITVCPMLTARMTLVQRDLTSPEIRFVSFSVDPDFDTPAVLKQYAAMWHGDQARWRLLNTKDDESLHETARGMHVAVQKSTDPVNPILHSNRFILIDAQGRVRGLYDSTDSQAVKQLTGDAERLLGMTAQEPASAFFPSAPGQGMKPGMPGKQLFAAVGCQACHSQPLIAPPLDGIAGATVMLDGGKTVVADDGYLRESIVDPNAKIVAGYLPRMPSYREQLTDAQVDSLVEYIKSLGSASPRELLVAASQPAVSADAVDPVCKMTVPVTNGTIHAEFAGRTYYFCSELCKSRFLKNPAIFSSRLTQSAATMP